MITLTKIAKLAHVSVSTVSKAFSMSNEVNEKTREMIFNVAREHKCFREYFNAKYPKYVVAIICPEFDSTYYSSTLSLIQMKLAQYNCEITVASTNFSNDTERELIEYYSKYTAVDAIINYGKINQQSVKSEIPIITMGMNDSGKNYVCHDYEESITKAVKYFISKGKTKIGFIGEELTTGKLYVLCKVAESLGITIKDEYISITKERFEIGGYNGMKKFFENNNLPDAVVCGYDDVAIGAMRCVKDRNLSVPEDILIMGMNNIDASAYVIPSLTSITLNNELTCNSVADMLMARLNGTDYPDFVVIKSNLLLRESTEI